MVNRLAYWFWALLSRVLSRLVYGINARRESADRRMRLPPGAVVVVEASDCACTKNLIGQEWAIASWNGDDYSLRGIKDGEAHFGNGMKYACLRATLRDTGRRIPVDRPRAS